MVNVRGGECRGGECRTIPMNCNKNANPSQLRDYVHRRLQGPPLHCTVRSEVDEISNNDNDKMLVMMDQCTMRLSPCKAVN